MYIRSAVFGILALLGITASWGMLSDVVSLSLRDGYDSYATLVPLFSAYMIWSRRKYVFSNASYDLIPGLITMGVGVSLQVTLSRISFVHDPFVSLELRFLALLTWLSGAFLVVYGRQAMKRALFPSVLLVFVVPLPTPLVDKVIAALQSGSTTAAYFLFSVLGTPVYREGFLLHVPGVTIEVAKECSGINSSIALVLTLVLVGYETLRTPSRRLILVLLSIPLSIAKNAIRIVTLTLLALHVDPSFLTGSLHHKGGIVFYLIGLAALYPIWKLLQRSENQNTQSNAATYEESTRTIKGALSVESRKGVTVSET